MIRLCRTLHGHETASLPRCLYLDSQRLRLLLFPSSSKQSPLPIQPNLSPASGAVELIVTRVKRKSVLRDRTRSRPELDPLLPVRYWQGSVDTLERGPLGAQLPHYPQKKQKSSASVRRIFTSPSTGRRTIEGQKDGHGRQRLAFKHLSIFAAGAKVVTSVALSAGLEDKRTRGR